MRVRAVLLWFLATVGVIGFAASPLTAHAASHSMGKGEIAFSAITNGVSEVKVIQLETGQKRHIAKNASNPQWSPNGKRLLIVDDATHRIQIMRADGRYVRHAGSLLAAGKESSPAWSPTGASVAFVRTKVVGGKTYGAIFTVKLHSGLERNITGWLKDGSYHSPSWSPDEKKLAYEKTFQGRSSLHIAAAKQNGEEREVTELSDSFPSSVAWSPNGKKILYSDSPNETYTIWPDGSRRAVISDGDSFAASWSPAGNRIIFLEDERDDHISLSESDGTVVWLPFPRNGDEMLVMPDWSPDEASIAVGVQASGGAHIRVMSLEDGTVSESLFASKGMLQEIDWRPRP